MRAGGLTEVIEIWKPVTVINEVGEQVTDYHLNDTTRANLLHNSGNRSISNGEIVFNYNKTFVIRKYHDINELDRIKWNNHYYRILDIEPNNQLQQLSIITEIINE